MTDNGGERSILLRPPGTRTKKEGRYHTTQIQMKIYLTSLLSQISQLYAIAVV